MKHVAFTLLLSAGIFIFADAARAQTNEHFRRGHPTGSDLKHEFGVFDLSSLFTITDNSMVYGFIGDNYQRLRIKFITVRKDPSRPYTYLVYGKSEVRNNICDFTGTLNINTIKKYSPMSYGVDDSYKNKGLKGEFALSGNYELKEDSSQKYPGVFRGAFISSFYLDKYNKVHYDDIDIISDGFTNNDFTGEWISNKSGTHKKCNWGDYRIPKDGDLDIGAGEFSPDGKYLKYGWQTIRDRLSNQNDKNAKHIEEAKWWL